MSLSVSFPAWSKPLIAPAPIKGAWGGRGGGKSHFFAEYAVLKAISSECRILCAREVQLSIKDSVKHLIEQKIKKFGLESRFHITKTEIKDTQTGSVFMFKGLKDQTADSVKSFEDVSFCWVEEAQTITEHSIEILMPTILRNDGAEVWFSWNPRNKTDAVEQLLRIDPDPDAVVVNCNYTDNPFIKQILVDQALKLKEKSPAKYKHIYKGGYSTISEGSFYAKEMVAVEEEGRILDWDIEELQDDQDVCVWMDLGHNDYTSVGFGKFVQNPVGEDEVHVIDYYENHFEHINHYIDIIKSKPYHIKMVHMPHDAKNKTIAAKKSAYEYVKDSGLPVQVIPRTKSVRDDIDGVKRILPMTYFMKSTTGQLTDHLMQYSRKKNATTGIWEEQPVHDEASHGADMFRYLSGTHPLNARSRGVVVGNLGGV